MTERVRGAINAFGIVAGMALFIVAVCHGEQGGASTHETLAIIGGVLVAGVCTYRLAVPVRAVEARVRLRVPWKWGE